ncbi:MAG: Bro-N domain-containing protein [Clostridia bacterium]
MEKENSIKLFEDKNIRVAWNETEENWCFSVVDIVAVLTENDYTRGRKYWSVLKVRLKEEGSELATNCSQLKMIAYDGKSRDTDVMDTEQILRLIQSIPSKKAEPFKLWLAKVGAERIDETYDPEIAINRALDTYRKKGYSEEWINQRLKTIDIRKEFTDELKRTGVNKNRDFAVLTNLLTQVWSGYNVKEYKNLKGLKKENLRDNMTNMELVLNMLAETSSTEISKGVNPQGFDETKETVIKGANVAKIAREQIEKESGKKIVSSKNARDKKALDFNSENK